VTSKYCDADTLHVVRGEDEFLFRLYFVDAPELDRRFGRAADQALYWGISEEQVVKNAQAATSFVTNLLEGYVSVVTKWEKIGNSSAPARYYAFIRVNGEDLGQLLLKTGYARVFGKETAGANGESKEELLATHRRIEAQSQRRRTGVWQIAANM